MSGMKPIIAAVLVVSCCEMLPAKATATPKEAGRVERVVAFAVGLEAQAGHLEGRRDLCIGFGHGLAVDEKAIVLRLRRNGLKMHRSEWCDRGRRGLRIGVGAPISETSEGTYELVLEASDLSIHEGEHFATLLSRGTYVVRCQNASEPTLVSYRRTCCAAQVGPGASAVRRPSRPGGADRQPAIAPHSRGEGSAALDLVSASSPAVAFASLTR